MATKYAPHTMTDAAARAKAKVGHSNRVGMCLAECINGSSSVYNIPTPWGWGGNGKAWAINYWLNAVAKGTVVKTSDPAKIPAGALAFMVNNSDKGKSKPSGAGHVFIGAGGGYAYSTDRPTNGKWGRVTIRSIESAWGKTLVGYIKVTGDGYTLTDKPAAVKAAAPKTRITHLRVAEQNCASNQPAWLARVPVLAKDVTKTKPHLISAVELYDAKRSALSSLIVGTYAKKISYYGKVQYLRRSSAGWVKVDASKTYVLGDGKHAVATRYAHQTTGAEIVLATPHLDWPHDAAAHRTAEAKKLVAFLKRDFAGLPWLIVGDCNDSHRPIADRPTDSSGAVFKAAGLHDLYFDCDLDNKVNREYNTANQGESPAPQHQIHIDRFWGSKELKGTGWVCHVYRGLRGSDHWPVSMSIDITHATK